MPKKSSKKKKDVDINIKINNLDKLSKKAEKWKCYETKWKSGIGFWGFGSSLAMILSYVQNSSIFWAIVHGILSWFYVIYRIIIDYGLFR
jgi:hypothetical protein